MKSKMHTMGAAPEVKRSSVRKLAKKRKFQQAMEQTLFKENSESIIFGSPPLSGSSVSAEENQGLTNQIITQMQLLYKNLKQTHINHEADIELITEIAVVGSLTYLYGLTGSLMFNTIGKAILMYGICLAIYIYLAISHYQYQRKLTEYQQRQALLESVLTTLLRLPPTSQLLPPLPRFSSLQLFAKRKLSFFFLAFFTVCFVYNLALLF